MKHVEAHVVVSVAGVEIVSAVVPLPALPTTVSDSALEGFVRQAALRALSQVRLADPAKLRAALEAAP